MKIFFLTLSSLLLSLGLLLLLLLQVNFQKMKARGELMLCLKETKGEFHHFITHIERLNWAIKHIDKAKYLVLIPGLQGVAANSQKARDLIIKYQNLTLLKFLAKLTTLQRRCRLSPETYKTPYQITGSGFKRKFDGTTFWRNQWSTKITGPYEVASMSISEKKTQRPHPEIQYRYSIKEVNALSLLPSLWALSR